MVEFSKAFCKFTFYVCCGMLILLFTIYVFGVVHDKVDFEPSSRVLVTAAHLGDIRGYTCVHSDADSDVGIYLKEGYKASAPPISAEVTYLETKGYVREVSDEEFIMEPLDIETIIPGVSGTPIYYDGKPIGYISGWNGHGLVRCIFY